MPTDILFIPDCHIGYMGDEPIHDDQAMDKVWAYAAAKKPRMIVILGDFLDLAGFGSYTTHPDLRNQVTRAIQTAYDRLHALRKRCPASDIYYLEGNHEHRINRYLCDNAPEAANIRAANSDVDIWSLRNLLHLDSLRIHYHGPYKTHLWLDGIRVLHGELLGRTAGDTASKMLKAYAEPSVCGHTHRLELGFKTQYFADGPRLTWAMSCGTLARLDGVVPGSHYPDWQQGFATLEDGAPRLHPI
jgi:hypothetical protein